MGVYIPNMQKPTSCNKCPFTCEALQFFNGKDRPQSCPLIEIAEPTETLIHDIRKLIAFIEPRMIIASTYAEQIERAEEVKDWLLSIVGERRSDEEL